MSLTKTISDKEVLKRFKNGNFIETKEELEVLGRYASTGMVHFGFNYKAKKPDASLTYMGRWLLKQMN